jgi:hypothetical protein
MKYLLPAENAEAMNLERETGEGTFRFFLGKPGSGNIPSPRPAKFNISSTT